MMGWVVFEKIYEDEDYIIYKYPHDNLEVIFFLANIFSKDVWDFPDKRVLAYG